MNLEQSPKALIRALPALFKNLFNLFGYQRYYLKLSRFYAEQEKSLYDFSFSNRLPINLSKNSYIIGCFVIILYQFEEIRKFFLRVSFTLYHKGRGSLRHFDRSFREKLKSEPIIMFLVTRIV